MRMSKASGLMPKKQAIDLILRSPETEQPELNVALFIASVALHGKKTWDGLDYDLHYLTVGLSNTQSRTKMVIGILHDVIEDSEWTLDDLRKVGFSERVVNGVDGVTKRNNEYYFDFIRRCSLNQDSIDVKLQDLKDNMRVSRNPGFPTPKQLHKQCAYIVSYQYLLAVKRGDIAQGAAINDFLKQRPDLYDARLMHDFSSEGKPPPLSPSFPAPHR